MTFRNWLNHLTWNSWVKEYKQSLQRVCSRYAAISMSSKTKTSESVCGILEERNTHRILEYFKLEGLILWLSFIQLSFSLSYGYQNSTCSETRNLLAIRFPSREQTGIVHFIDIKHPLFSVVMQPGSRNVSSKLPDIWLSAKRRNTEEIGKGSTSQQVFPELS